MILAPLKPRLLMGYAQKRLLNRTTFLHLPSFQVLARCILTNVVVDGSVKGCPLDFCALLTSLRSRLAVIFLLGFSEVVD